MKNKIVIIGCGNVGISYAYALINQRTNVNEIVLIDINEEKARGEAEDLNHGLSFVPSKLTIRVGDYNDCKDATIICIAAGQSQFPGETRMDLIYKNNEVFKMIINRINFTGFNGIYLIATNPVDVMTYLVCKYSNFPQSRVIGSGTILDTARLRHILSDKLSISSKNIHAYVMGEHGDSEFVPWSNAYVGSTSVSQFLNRDELEIIAYTVKNAAYDIIRKKGSTCYGIGMSLVRITNAILENENAILTVSSYDEKNNVFIGCPSLINRTGVVKRMKVELTEEESILYDNSVNIVRNAVDKII